MDASMATAANSTDNSSSSSSATTPTRALTLLGLPSETLLQILETVGRDDLLDLLCAKRVCRTFSHIIDSTSSLQQLLFFQPSSSSSSSSSSPPPDDSGASQFQKRAVEAEEGGGDVNDRSIEARIKASVERTRKSRAAFIAVRQGNRYRHLEAASPSDREDLSMAMPADVNPVVERYFDLLLNTQRFQYRALYLEKIARQRRQQKQQQQQEQQPLPSEIDEEINYNVFGGLKVTRLFRALPWAYQRTWRERAPWLRLEASWRRMLPTKGAIERLTVVNTYPWHDGDGSVKRSCEVNFADGSAASHSQHHHRPQRPPFMTMGDYYNILLSKYVDDSPGGSKEWRLLCGKGSSQWEGKWPDTRFLRNTRASGKLLKVCDDSNGAVLIVSSTPDYSLSRNEEYR